MDDGQYKEYKSPKILSSVTLRSPNEFSILLYLNVITDVATTILNTDDHAVMS